MSLVRVLLPVAFAWVAIAGCGQGPEGRPARVGAPDSTSGALMRRAGPRARPHRTAGDPILERIRALARKDSSATKPSLEEMLPPLKGASTPYDIAQALERRTSRPTPPEKAPEPARKTPPRAPVKRPVPVTTPPRDEAEAGLTLAPGDELYLTVDGQPEFSGKVKVREDGTVALPTTGDPVPASGKTLEEVARAVADAISPRYVKRKPGVSARPLRSPGPGEGGTR